MSCMCLWLHSQKGKSVSMAHNDGWGPKRVCAGSKLKNLRVGIQSIEHLHSIKIIRYALLFLLIAGAV
jgi:hypothetical protein